MAWLKWLIALLIVVNAGWMLFDGARALVVGEYITPRTGAHAGRLGPWSRIVGTVGIDPRSALMKWIFVLYGACFLAALVAYLTGLPWGWSALIVWAILGLWHAPFGTLINIVVILLLQLAALRTPP